MTMSLIGSTTVGAGGASTITFSSIPQTATDLYLVVSGRSSVNNTYGQNTNLNFNGSTTGYTERVLRMILGYDRESTSTSNYTNFIYAITLPGSQTTAGTFGTSTIYIPNYTGNTNKTICSDYVTENNNAASSTLGIVSGVWANTAAITSITIANSFSQYTVASLYGITKGSGGATITSS